MNYLLSWALASTLVLLVSPNSLACSVGGSTKVSKKKIDSLFTKKNRSVSSTDLPLFAGSHPKPTWEARLGNVLLNYQPAKVGKVAISIPARIQRSTYNPFGDGQTNAKMNLDSTWTQSADFPVIGIESVENGKTQRVYKFDPSLKVTKYSEKLLPDGWYEVRPENWDNVFYFNFKTGSLPLKDFLSGIPESRRIFPKNRVAPNIAQISQDHAYIDLSSKDLGFGYNKEAWLSDSVHGKFPNENGEVTARGSVQTWGIKTKPEEEGSFKNLYTCFQPRDISLENDKNLPTGVPSGAGWHHVGDVGETLLNNLNRKAIPFAVARTHGKSNAAYSMEDNITATWLQSDEVQVTQQGEFHWYLNPYDETVCTELWVQNCVPNDKNNWGFGCN